MIACGAIARELVRIRELNGWDHIEFQCLPADLHNVPERIPGEVRRKIDGARGKFARIFVAYADCGTGGMLSVSEQHIRAGTDTFHGLAEEEPGTFYLTDFLVRHFDRLVVRGLGLDRQPELLSAYFANYRRVVYLAQSDSVELQEQARRHAEFLGLEYHFRHCGDRPLAAALEASIGVEHCSNGVTASGSTAWG